MILKLLSLTLIFGCASEICYSGIPPKRIIKVQGNFIQEQHDDFYMEIPANLIEFNEDEIKLKYPGANRPNMVYGNKGGSVTVGLSLNVAQILDEELPLFISSTKEGLLNNLNVEWISDNFQDINGYDFAILRFYSNSTNGRIYNMMVAAVYNNKLILITFNCLYTEMSHWKVEFDEMVKSISFHSRK